MIGNINLTPILQALLGLLAAVITYRLVPWLKERTTAEQMQRYQAAVRVAVFAAEQIFGAGHGAEKMDYAIKYLRDKGQEELDRIYADARQNYEAKYAQLGIDKTTLKSRGYELVLKLYRQELEYVKKQL